MVQVIDSVKSKSPWIQLPRSSSPLDSGAGTSAAATTFKLIVEGLRLFGPIRLAYQSFSYSACDTVVVFRN